MTTSRSGPPRTRPADAGHTTIQDVARAAGVGRQTVSNVLNDSGRVGEATKVRVLEAVATLGYHPHHGARSLRSRRTGQVAYVQTHALLRPSNYVMQRFLQSLAAASGRQSYNMVVAVPDGDPREEMRRLIASRTVDAFLLSELQPEDLRVVLLAEAGIPFSCFGRIGSGLPQHWVDIDNRAAIVEVVEHVLTRGFGRLAFVGYRGENHWDHERVAGFRAGLARRGVPEDEADVLLVDEASARRKIRSLLTGTHRRGAHAVPRPDAIVTGSDRLAAMIYGVAAELRLRIGRDLGVTGFDGSVAAGLLHPRLTSVTVPVEDIARRVIAQALRQLDHGPDEGPGEVVPATLRLGESTGDGTGPGPGPRLDGATGHGRPRTVAVLVAHMTRPSTVVRVASALAVLAEEGYDTIVCNVDTLAERDRHLETLLPTHRAGGVLAISLPVPGQLSVVGFDDIESAAVLGLSTVRQPLARSGTEGALRLCALLRGERLRVRREELPLELVARASTARRDAS